MPSIARGRTSAGGIIVVKPAAAGLVHRHVDQRELEVGAGAGQVVEAGAGHLGAAVDVDRAEDPAELDVVLRLEPLGGEVAGLADVLEHDEVVLAAGRRLLGGRVRDPQQRRAGRPPRPRPGPPRRPSPRPPSALVRARSSCFSSPCACGICLPSVFCSARSRSNSDDRRRAGALSAARPRRRRPRTARAAPARRGRGRGRHGGRGDRSPAHAIDGGQPAYGSGSTGR